MINCIILDDEPLAIKVIENFIKKYIQKGLFVSDIIRIFEFNQLDNQLKPLLYELVHRF